MRFQTFVERAEDETSGLGWVIVFAEVGKGPSGETQGAALAIDILITKAEEDLGQIGLGAFGFGGDHFVDAVDVGGDLACDHSLHLGQSVVQSSVEIVLERVKDPLASLMQIVLLNLLLISVFVQSDVVLFVDIDNLLLDISLDLLARDAIRSPHCEGIGDEPVVDYPLGCCYEVIGGIRAYLQPNWVDQATCTRADHFLLEGSWEQLAFADDHGVIISVFEAIFAFPHLNSDLLGDDHAHDLLAGPERLRFQNSRHGQFSREELTGSLALALLALDPDDEVHNFFPGEEGISHGEEIDAEEGILNDTHDRGVAFGGDDLFGDMGDVFEFGGGLVWLGHVHVHLVTVEVGVVGGADRQVESEGVVR